MGPPTPRNLPERVRELSSGAFRLHRLRPNSKRALVATLLSVLKTLVIALASNSFERFEDRGVQQGIDVSWNVRSLA
jgi:hypothetical protein